MWVFLPVYISRTNFTEGTVNCEALEKPVLVQGLERLNRSVDGDTVVVRLFDKSQWSSPSDVVLEDEGYDKGDTLEGGDDVKAKKAPGEVSGKDLMVQDRLVLMMDCF